MAGKSGFGGVLSVGTAGATTAITNIRSITGPDMSRNSIDISSSGMTTKYREYDEGMIDPGEITVELVYDGATTGAAIIAAQITATQTTWTVNFNDSTSTDSFWTCNGFVTALGHVLPYDDVMTQSATIKLSGKQTHTSIS